MFCTNMLWRGISSASQAETILEAGFEKISINSAALKSPKILKDIDISGSKCCCFNRCNKGTQMVTRYIIHISK